MSLSLVFLCLVLLYLLVANFGRRLFPGLHANADCRHSTPILWDRAISLCEAAQASHDPKQQERCRDQAGIYFQEIAKRRPDWSGVWLEWGNMTLQRARQNPLAACPPLWRKAEELYEKAAATAPDDPAPHRNIALLLKDRIVRAPGEEAGRLGEAALSHCEQALKKAQGDSRLIHEMSKIERELRAMAP